MPSLRVALLALSVFTSRAIAQDLPNFSADESGHPQLQQLPPTARTTVGWTLPDLEGLALANNPTLRQAAARVEAARGRWVQAGLYPNPRIGYEGTEIGNEGTAGLQGGFLAQEIVRGGKLGLDRDVASQEIIQRQAGMDAQRLRVLSDVRIEYRNVLLAQKALDFSATLLRLSEQGQTAAEQLFNAKEVGRADILQARIEANNARIAIDNARNRRQAASHRLAAVVGMPSIGCEPIVGELPSSPCTFEWCTALEALMTGSPEIAEARANVSRAQLALGRTVAETVPNLDVRAGMQYDDGTGDTVTNVEVALPIRIFDRNQGNIRQAEAELRLAEDEVVRMELAIRHRLAGVFERYSNARQQVARYEQDILPDAQGTLDLVKSGYQEGEFSFVNFLTAQRTYFQTNLAYLEGLRELWIAAAELEGMLLSGSLNVGDQG